MAGGVRIPIKTDGGQQAVDDLNKVGDAGQRALDRINKASKEPSAGLRALNSATSEVRRGLDDLGGRAGVIGRIMSDIGPMGLAAAAGIGAFAAGLGRAVAEADESERARLRIEALLRTTQGASGQTYESIARIAEGISETTRATQDGVLEAAGALLTFKSVSGDAFERTLRLGQDVAAVMKTDLQGAVVQLAKALEDPESKLSALNRSGISFNETQIEMVKHLVETGQKTRALSEILDIIEGQLGGAGAADAGTLSGAFHVLNERIEAFFEKIGNTGPLETFTDIVRTMAEGMGVIDRAVFDSVDEQAAAKFQQLADARARLDDLLNNPTERLDGAKPEFSIQQTRERIAALEAELKALTGKIQAEAKNAEAAKQSAQAAKIAAMDEAMLAQSRERDVKHLNEIGREREAVFKKEQAEQQRINKTRADARASINGQVDALKNEQKALALAERERAIFLELLKAEETARKAGIAVTNEQREAIIKETGALFDQKRAIEEKEEADKKAERAAEKAARERERLAEREAEAMQRPFEHAAEGIQDAFTGAFEDIFSGNVRNFSDLAGEIKQVFVRLAAEVATLMVFNPRASFGAILGGTGLFGSGTAAAGAQAAGGGGSGGLVSGLSGLAGMSKLLSNNGRGFGSILGDTSWGNIGANIGAGFAGNAIGGWAASKWGGGKSGGNVGGTIGGAIGSIWGPIGSFVGSALGNFVGSFIGGGPSDRAQAGSVNLGTGNTYNQHGQSGKKFSQENANLRDQVLQQASQFAQMLRETTGGTISQALSVVIGSRDGLRYQFGGGPLQNAGKSVDALMAGINRGIINSLSGIPAELKAVVSRIDFSNLQQAAQDIAFANSIIKKEFVQAEPLNAAAQAIAALNDQFKPLIDNAARLGLSLAPINAEWARQRALLTSGFNDEIDRAILSITDPLAAALAAFDDMAAERLANARTLGADLVDVERLTALERAQIIEQYGQQANGALLQANQSIEQFLTGLRTGGAYLSPAATLANAESEFARLLGLAQGGDLAARGGLSGAAGALLEASREAWGSSEMFFQRLNFVESSLGNLIGQGSSTTTFDNLGVTIAQGNSSLEYQLVQLNNKVAELTAVVADQQASLARLAAA